MTPEAWRAGGSYFAWRGHRVFHRREGRGPPLLLVHGFPTSSWDWHRVWEALTARFDVLALDLLGYGFSDKPRSHDYPTDGQADLVEALCHHHGMDACAVLAHDYGDTVVQELLARQLGGGARIRLRAACLLNGGIFYEAIRKRPIQRILLSPLGPLVAKVYTRSAFGRSMRSLFAPGRRPSEEELDHLWSLLERDGGREVVPRLIRYLPERRERRDRWLGALVESTVPIRLVVGLEDPVSGASIAERYRELVPEPDVVELEAVGHFPQLEAPRAVEEAALALFAAIPGDELQ